MAKIGKRNARHQLTKDAVKGEGENGGGATSSSDEMEKPAQSMPVEKRVLSKPVSRLSRRSEGGSFNPFAALKTRATASSGSALGNNTADRPLNAVAPNTKLNTKEKEALMNLKALNEAFSKALWESLTIDPFIDFTSLFGQYEKHRRSVEERFELAQQTKSLSLGFEYKVLTEKPANDAASGILGSKRDAKPPAMSFKPPEIRPVSVDLPSFAVKDIPPTPIIVSDTNRGDDPVAKFPSMPSPQSQPTLKFTFPQIPALPAFGSSSIASDATSTTSSNTTSAAIRPLFTFGAPPPSELSAATINTANHGKPAFTFPDSQGFRVTSDKPTFSFPAPSSASFPSSTPAATADNSDEDGILEDEAESFSNVRTNGELVKRGKGEEDEEEILDPLRCKLFIFDTSASGWTDLGIGLVKVNRGKASGKTRILCRAEGSGRLLLNAYLDPQVSTSQYEAGKRDTLLTCFNQDSKLAKYLIRTKEMDQATSLHSALSSLPNAK